MDQGKAFLLICSGLLLAADRPAALPLSEVRWLAAGAPLERLLNQPGECVAWPAKADHRDSARVGQVAFRAPLLLGGQAARAGLSCASCHRNGRDNRDFHFPGISGAAGTADITASLFSSHRGDGQFNPRPIPDLADPSKQTVARSGDAALRTFIRGLIVEEFDGPEPTDPVLDGLVHYVRSMDLAACNGDAAITLTGELRTIEHAVRLAEEHLTTPSDARTARFLISAARSSLGRIDERFTVGGLEAERTILEEAAKELGLIQQGLETAGDQPLLRWSSAWAGRQRALLKAEPRSLYSAAVLRRFARRD